MLQIEAVADKACLQAVSWLPEGAVRLLDQRRLPELATQDCHDEVEVLAAMRCGVVAGAAAPKLVRRDMLSNMRRNAVVVDVDLLREGRDLQRGAEQVDLLGKVHHLEDVLGIGIEAGRDLQAVLAEDAVDTVVDQLVLLALH